MNPISEKPAGIPVHEDVYNAIFKYFHPVCLPKNRDKAIDYTDKNSLKAAAKVHNFITMLLQDLKNGKRADPNILRMQFSKYKFFARENMNGNVGMDFWMDWVVLEAKKENLEVEYRLEWVSSETTDDILEGCFIKVTKQSQKQEPEEKENKPEAI